MSPAAEDGLLGTASGELRVVGDRCDAFSASLWASGYSWICLESASEDLDASNASVDGEGERDSRNGGEESFKGGTVVLILFVMLVRASCER
jgi:hypothetical protein